MSLCFFLLLKCAPGLVCFQRDRFQTVPGCRGGEHDSSRTDYCVEASVPNPVPSPRPTPQPNGGEPWVESVGNGTFRNPFRVVVVYFVCPNKSDILL